MNIDKIRFFAQKYDMLPAGSRVLCALSGGADSVCLLSYLASTKGIRLVAAHYNHRLRGAESDRDEDFVRKLCEDMGILCIVGSGDVASFAAERGMGTEEAARTLRYEFLRKTAEEQGCDRIATAHNANDNVETIIMNLARGAGIKGLSGIPPVRGNIVRPLLETSRREIEEYISENKLPHVEDSSNASDDYNRNRVRHHVLPVLEGINPGYAETVAAAAESLREDEKFLDSLARDFIVEHSEGNTLPVGDFLSLPGSVQKRVVRIMHGGQLSTEHVRSVINICLMRSVHAAVDVPGMRVQREYGRLIFGAEEARPIPERELIPGDSFDIPQVKLSISCRKDVFCGEIHNSLTNFVFKNANICGRIFVASRRDGDKIAIAGRGCTKSLKKLFMERRMTPAERLTTPVFFDEEGPIAVAGFGIAQRVQPEAGDEVIIIEIKKEEDEDHV